MFASFKPVKDILFFGSDFNPFHNRTEADSLKNAHTKPREKVKERRDRDHKVN